MLRLKEGLSRKGFPCQLDLTSSVEPLKGRGDLSSNSSSSSSSMQSEEDRLWEFLYKVNFIGLSNLMGLKLRYSNGSGDLERLEEGVGEEDKIRGLAGLSGGL